MVLHKANNNNYKCLWQHHFSVMNRLMKAGSVLVAALDLSHLVVETQTHRHCTSASACSTDQTVVCPAPTPWAPLQQGPQQQVISADCSYEVASLCSDLVCIQRRDSSCAHNTNAHMHKYTFFSPIWCPSVNCGEVQIDSSLKSKKKKKIN